MNSGRPPPAGSNVGNIGHLPQYANTSSSHLTNQQQPPPSHPMYPQSSTGHSAATYAQIQLMSQQQKQQIQNQLHQQQMQQQQLQQQQQQFHQSRGHLPHHLTQYHSAALTGANGSSVVYSVPSVPHHHPHLPPSASTSSSHHLHQGGPSMPLAHQIDPATELTLFEKDIEKMFEWLRSNHELFMSKYSKIGRSSDEAKNLQSEHSYFHGASLEAYTSIKRLSEVANRLVKTNHKESHKVSSLITQLDHCWHDFKSALEERASILSLAALYYGKAESFIRSVRSWSEDLECSNLPSIPTDINQLEELVHKNQNLFDSIVNFKEEIHKDKGKLVKQLERFVQFCYQYHIRINATAGNSSSASSPSSTTHTPSRNPTQDFNDATKHVFSMMNEVMSRYRALEDIWKKKKITLHQKLALALFQDDVRQVIEWIEEHGEGFLRRNLVIGKNLSSAQALQKSHRKFESVASNTYTNGYKLLAAAEEFASTESDETRAKEIHEIAKKLKSHVKRFAEKVERRKQLLNLATMFYTHEKDICGLMEELRSEAKEIDSKPFEAPESVELCEKQLRQAISAGKQLIDAIDSCHAEGEVLLKNLNDILASPEYQVNYNSTQSGYNASSADVSSVSSSLERKGHSSNDTNQPSNASSSSADSIIRTSRHNITSSMSAIESVIQKLTQIRPEAEQLCATRQIRLNLCLQLRRFESEALSLCQSFEVFASEIEKAQRIESESHWPLDLDKAEELLSHHNDSFSRIQQMAYDFFQKGQELAQVSKKVRKMRKDRNIKENKKEITCTQTHRHRQRLK